MKNYKTFNFVINSLKNFKLLVSCRLLVAIIVAIDISLRPYILKTLLDKSMLATPEKAFSDLGPAALLFMFMTIFIRISYRFNDYIWLKLHPNLRKMMTLKLIDKMMNQSHHFYQNHFAGNLSNKIKDVMNGVPTLILTVIDSFFSHAIAFCLVIGTLNQISFKFALAFFFWVISYFWMTVRQSFTAQKYSKQTAEVRSKVIGNIVDVITNVSNVRLFTNKDEEQNLLSEKLQEQIIAEQKREWYFLKIFTWQSLIFIFYQGLSLYWLIVGFKAGEITTGDFALVVTLNSSVSTILWSLSSDLTIFIEKAGDISQSLEVLMAQVEVIDQPAAKELALTSGKIIFDDITFGYKNADVLFNNLSLSIKSGEKIGLVGYSGSGKTSLVNLLLRLFDLNQGRILIDDQNIAEVTQASLRAAISMIQQDPSLFHRSLLDNIKYGRPDASFEEIMEASIAAHAYEFISLLPEGYNTLVGERGIKLSGGQRQRVSIARAFLKNAPILILDEATSQLDSLTEKFIQESLQKLMMNKTTIVIAHRFSTLLHMDRIVVLDHGKILQTGNHKELLQEEGLYKKLWSSQISDFLPI